MTPAKRTIGDKAADWLTNNIGRWAFIAIQTALYAFWIAWNRCMPAQYCFDSRDFLNLNLGIGIFGNYALSILLMSQNKQLAKDRHTLEKTYQSERHGSLELDQVLKVLQDQGKALEYLTAKKKRGIA